MKAAHFCTLVILGAALLSTRQSPAQNYAAGYQFYDVGLAPSGGVAARSQTEMYLTDAQPTANGAAPLPPDWAGTSWEESQLSGLEALEAAGPCCARCGRGYCCPDDWYWYTGVRVYNRSQPRRVLLSQNLQGVTAMETRSVTFDIAAAYDGTFGHYLGRDTENRDQFVEFAYWGLNEWEMSRTVNGALVNYGTQQDPLWQGTLFSYFTSVPGFDFAETHRMVYRSETHSFELNARIRPRGRPDRLVLQPNGQWERQCQEGWYLSYLFGLRGMSLDEGFIFQSSGRSITNQGTYSFGALQHIRTHNDMFGFQIGADLIYRKCRLEYGVRTKIAPMINWCDQFTDITATGLANPVARYARNDDLAFYGEVSIVGSYKLAPRFVVYASFDFSWLLGMALAPEQVDFALSSTPFVNDNGIVFCQGLTVGVEATF